LLEARRTEQGLETRSDWEWRALAFTQIDAALRALDLEGSRRVEISTERLESA